MSNLAETVFNFVGRHITGGNVRFGIENGCLVMEVYQSTSDKQPIERVAIKTLDSKSVHVSGLSALAQMDTDTLSEWCQALDAPAAEIVQQALSRVNTQALRTALYFVERDIPPLSHGHWNKFMDTPLTWFVFGTDVANPACALYTRGTWRMETLLPREKRDIYNTLAVLSPYDGSEDVVDIVTLDRPEFVPMTFKYVSENRRLLVSIHPAAIGGLVNRLQNAATEHYAFSCMMAYYCYPVSNQFVRLNLRMPMVDVAEQPVYGFYHKEEWLVAYQPGYAANLGLLHDVKYHSRLSLDVVPLKDVQPYLISLD